MKSGVAVDMLKAIADTARRAHSECRALHQELFMRAIKKARKLIEARPETQAAITLSQLVVALESEEPFALSELYQLDCDDFGLALELMAEWRLDRDYTSKVRLLGVAVQSGEQTAPSRKVA